MGKELRHTHVEDLIFDHLIRLHGQGGVSLRFPVNCEPHGVGGNGENLRGAKRIVKSSIRAVCRHVAPDLWL
jgi:hypothetical protein